MNKLSEMYFNMQCRLFPLLEEEIGEITEKLLLVYFLKSVYNLPTTKVLIENLKGNSTWRQLCGWEFYSQVPSEATFSRAFKEFAELNLLDKMLETVVKENYKKKLVGHASMDSTAINGREKFCRKNTPKKAKKKKKRGRKSKAELAAMKEQELAEVKTRRLELQSNRSIEENFADLPHGCDWGGKKNCKGKTEYWCGYKLHLSLADGGVPLGCCFDFSFSSRPPSCNSIDANDFGAGNGTV